MSQPAPRTDRVDLFLASTHPATANGYALLAALLATLSSYGLRPAVLAPSPDLTVEGLPAGLSVLLDGRTVHVYWTAADSGVADAMISVVGDLLANEGSDPADPPYAVGMPDSADAPAVYVVAGDAPTPPGFVSVDAYPRLAVTPAEVDR